MEKCPAGYVCFNREIFILVALGIIALAIYGFKNRDNEKISSYGRTQSESQESHESPNLLRINNLEQSLNQQREKLNQLSEGKLKETMVYNNVYEPDNRTTDYPFESPHQREIRRIQDPLQGPERQFPYVMSRNTMPINIPTRGYDTEYQQVGAIYSVGNQGKQIILPLFGKPNYAGSHKWLYYTSSDNYNSVKIPIFKDGKKCQGDFGCDELSCGDFVNASPYNCKFKVELYEIDKPRYLPNVF